MGWRHEKAFQVGGMEHVALHQREKTSRVPKPLMSENFTIFANDP